MTEQWKRIPGFEQYLVSNLGRIKSLKGNSERILKLNKKRTGYQEVQLGKHGGWFLVHRLVAFAFLDNKDQKPHVNHKNGRKDDNRLINLEWVTRSENQLHAYRTGLQPYSNHQRAYGENHSQSKLDYNKVKWIRNNYKRGDAVRFGKMFDVSQTTILNIINNKTWNK